MGQVRALLLLAGVGAPRAAAWLGGALLGLALLAAVGPPDPPTAVPRPGPLPRHRRLHGLEGGLATLVGPQREC